MLNWKYRAYFYANTMVGYGISCMKIYAHIISACEVTKKLPDETIHKSKQQNQ